VGKELERRKRNLKILLSNHFKVRNVSNVGELLLVIKNTNWSKQLLFLIIIIISNDDSDKKNHNKMRKFSSNNEIDINWKL
jgi:hypothetical protein